MWTGKSLKFSLILITALFISGCAPDAVDSFGHPIRISDYRGKWVVINYWASWCGECIQEIPELNKLVRYYKDKVVVLGVTVDNFDNMALRTLGEGYRVEYPLLLHFPIEKFGLKPHSLPVTYILDPNGKLYKVLTGPQKFENFQAVMKLPPISYD